MAKKEVVKIEEASEEELPAEEVEALFDDLESAEI